MTVPSAAWRLPAQRSLLALASLGLKVLLASSTPVAAQPIVEFPTPTTNSGPSSIVLAPDGNLYFTEAYANKIGRLAPDGAIAEFPLPSSRCGPGSIAFGPDGNLWFTRGCDGGIAGHYPPPVGIIGRMTPTGATTEFSVSPYALPTDITAGPDGNLWFAGGVIGRMTINGVATYFSPPATGGTIEFYPWGVVAGPDGNIWFTEAGSAKVGKISMAGVITEFALTADRRSEFITVGPDGNLWFTENYVGPAWIGRITPSGQITEYPVPTPDIGYSRITAGHDGNLWFTEPGTDPPAILNKIGRITVNGSITEFTTPTPSSGPAGITGASDGSVWFTEQNASNLAKVNLSHVGECSPTATTLCLAGSRFQVDAQWRRPTDLVPAAGHAVAITSDTGYFWFFDASNTEVVAKVLNGCQLDDSYWFFAGGLTNIEVTLTVTDAQTKTVRTYTNSQGTAFLPIQDTAAFSTCP